MAETKYSSSCLHRDSGIHQRADSTGRSLYTLLLHAAVCQLATLADNKHSRRRL